MLTRARIDPAAQAYIARRAGEGKTTREAKRALKGPSSANFTPARLTAHSSVTEAPDGNPITDDQTYLDLVARPRAEQPATPYPRLPKPSRSLRRPSGQLYCYHRLTPPSVSTGEANLLFSHQRIAVVHHSSAPCGSVTVCAQLVKGLRALGAEAHFFTLANFFKSEHLGPDVPHTFVGRAPVEDSHREQAISSSKVLAENLDPEVLGQCDVVHIHDVIDHMAIRRIRSGIRGVLIVRTVHHLYEAGEEWLVDIQGSSVMEADQLVAVSDYWSARIYDRYRRSAVVIRNGMDLSRFRSAPNELGDGLWRERASNSLTFLNVGGLSPRKGTIELLQAFAATKKALSGLGVQLVILGGRSPNPYHEYRTAISAEIARLGLVVEKDVIFLGTVSGGELIDAYRTADVFVFPSLVEGWGLAALEAMAAGLPVIMSDLPVFREFASPSDAVFVRPGHVQDLAEAMQALALSPERRAVLGVRGEAVAARYSWDKTANEHASLYNVLLTT